MSVTDAAGLLGVLLILVAYAGASLGKLDPKLPLSLAANLVGAGLILFSLLTADFNLSATVMEGAWERGHDLTVHGWIYSLSDGRIRDLGVSVTADDNILACRENAVQKLMSKPPLWL